ncbi:FadR/GntR family transcriptional regulator [Homoserinibacter sp. YIM 151385]|uniref:FadR/GntR family transcriptional regulator n=1 Tax=Homoserinibacter sp. YIM 151385 TaxID=2985506 RepID=UPI0022F052EC|nr:FadR/GntR family transcriptional regulator [Homoserinibacter sp. YIM 151385]WBU36886.1 FadR/GntR family transcriptional regulator [Homoserinibacter sp. YIM 151385]
MAFDTTSRLRLSESVAEQLREAIRAGDYPAGAKLPTEAQLSETMGVGRTTVREAVRALITEGLLVSRQGSGVYATGKTPYGERLATAALVEIFHARCAIETYAAELACRHRTEEDLLALEHALAHRDQVPSRTPEFAARDIAVHRAIVAASGNTVLLDVFVSLEPRLVEAFVDSRFLDRADPGRANAHVDAHYDIVGAIRARDAEEAVRLARLLQAGAIAVLEGGEPLGAETADTTDTTDTTERTTDR